MFGWFNHRKWLLYGQPNFWLSEQNSLVNKIWLIIPLFWLIQPNTIVNLKRRFLLEQIIILLLLLLLLFLL